MRRSQIALLFVSVLSWPTLGSPVADWTALKAGVVVEGVASKWVSTTIDVKEGDVFLAWSCGNKLGISEPLNNPFDLFDIELRASVCGGIEFRGMRGARPHTWLVGQTYWGITVRPRFTGNLEELYLAGTALVKKGQAGDAEKCWSRIVLFHKSYVSWLRPWLLVNAADASADGGLWKDAEDEYGKAIQAAESSDPKIMGQVLYAYAEALLARNDWTNTAKYYHLALSESLKAPKNYLAAALCLNGLGTAANRQGNLIEAERYFQRDVAILRIQAPNGLSFSTGIANLGMVAFYRGDLALAEKYFRQALSSTQKLAPGTLDLAKALNSVGVTLLERGEPSRAEEYFQKALSLTEKVEGSEGEGAAVLLYNSARVAEQREDFAAAEGYALHALAIANKIEAEGIWVAKYSNYLGNLNRKLGRLPQAEQYIQTALRIGGKVAPRSLVMSGSFNAMGDLYRTRSDVARAAHCYQEASDIERLIAPGSTALAESLGSWAEMLQMQNRQSNKDFVGKLYDEALRALEAQTAHLGGTEGDRSTFRSQHAGIWRGYAELLLDQKNPGVALEVIERSRAQSLMEILVAGRVGIRNGVDRNVLDEMHSVKRSLAIKLENRAGLLAQSYTPQQLAAADQEIAKIIARRDELDAAIQRASPRYAALAQSKALKLTEMQALLDQDTTLVEYMLGDTRSRVWIVKPQSVGVYELPSRSMVETSARKVYLLLSQNRCGPDNPEWRQAVAKLSHMVIGPIKKELNGKRLAVVSDGALQYIPFGILPAEDSGAPLITDHEIVALPSASVLAVLRSERARRRPPVNSVAVMADPVFDSGDERVKRANSELDAMASSRPTALLPEEHLMRSRADVGQNGHLPRLVSSRREATAILAATPGIRKMAALDFAASRAQAISGTLARYRIVHFATHAFLDSFHPELSGLVLSLVDPKGKPQNGFLSLGDVYNLNLPADVVVLSACDTALGKEIDGEGLIGLTRGFMYAGATRVVASLWKVDDVASAELMDRFYRRMEQQGLTPAAALTMAQREMSKEWSPFYWAGFQIQGEWR
jgi:CHAT domain-containing protein/Tfp pilus assembly protein PilF